MHEIYEKKIIYILFFIIATTIIYNIYDSNRIAIISQEVKIKNLPKSFEGFKILQITDLHGKRFGAKQEYLTKKINSLPYDMIAITGDMQDKTNKDDGPFLEMLDGIKTKENMYYVSGNQGPKFSQKLSEMGCISVNQPREIKRGSDSIWVYDYFDGKFNSEIKAINNNSIKIAITHYPFDEGFYKTAKDKIGEYDLVLAGHYHGGQIRMPFYGALFIPNINGNTFFPKQNEVSGLNTYGRYNQYVSRGLGASKDGIFRFRLFNTPEINLITLVEG